MCFDLLKAVYIGLVFTLAKLMTMQNEWWTGLAERIQQCSDMGYMCAFYEAMERQWTLTSDPNPSAVFG